MEQSIYDRISGPDAGTRLIKQKLHRVLSIFSFDSSHDMLTKKIMQFTRSRANNRNDRARAASTCIEIKKGNATLRVDYEQLNEKNDPPTINLKYTKESLNCNR